jgi:lipopolysaccharide biosynthesis regulator YciM
LTDTAVVAVAVAALAGLLAGRAWTRALRRGPRGGDAFRASAHFSQGLNYLAAGRPDLAITELNKVAKEDEDAVEVRQVLSHLLREAGQVEKAIQLHQRLLARPDLTRAERAYTLAGLGTDFRKAGFLDRASRVYQEALEIEPNNLHALSGQQRLYEEQRQWRDAYEVRSRLARLRKTDDGLVLGHLQAEMGAAAARAGERALAESHFKTALAHSPRVFPAHLGLADLYIGNEPARAAAILEDAIKVAPGAASRLARARGAGPPPEGGRALRGSPGPPHASARGQSPGLDRAPRGLADPAGDDRVGAGHRAICHHGRDRGLLSRPSHLHHLPVSRR